MPWLGSLSWLQELQHLPGGWGSCPSTCPVQRWRAAPASSKWCCMYKGKPLEPQPLALLPYAQKAFHVVVQEERAFGVGRSCVEVRERWGEWAETQGRGKERVFLVFPMWKCFPEKKDLAPKALKPDATKLQHTSKICTQRHCSSGTFTFVSTIQFCHCMGKTVLNL